MRCIAVALVGLLAIPLSVQASNDEAWREFREQVELACRALVDQPGVVQIAVSAFGSQSYGAALVTVTAPGGAAEAMICVYHKETRSAELTASLTP